MRHRKLRGKLSRESSHRKAMLRNMTASLLEFERIQTTLARAKELRKFVDHVITLAKQETLHARRQVIELIPNQTVVAKLFSSLASRYSGRKGGYTRIYRLGIRRGDAAPIAVVELVDAQLREPPKKQKEDEKK